VLASSERANLNHWPKRDVSLTSPTDGNRYSFRNGVLSTYLEVRTTNKVHKLSDFEVGCYVILCGFDLKISLSPVSGLILFLLYIYMCVCVCVCVCDLLRELFSSDFKVVRSKN
jgi:hypothetical protein